MISPARIVFEDKALLVIEKASGITTTREGAGKGSATIQDWAEANIFDEDFFRNQRGRFRERSGIVHRLDKDTSGLLVIAKNQDAFANLQKQFKERRVEKEYLTLVDGDIPREGSIVAPIGRGRGKYFSVRPGARKSATNYSLLKKINFQGKTYSFVRVFPQTGRTHQIRVHFRYLGFPIVGDKIYGNSNLPFPVRLFLHACRLKFLHPETNTCLDIAIDLPRDLDRYLKKLDSST